MGALLSSSGVDCSTCLTGLGLIVAWFCLRQVSSAQPTSRNEAQPTSRNEEKDREHQLALEERELSNRKAVEDLQAQIAELKKAMQEKDQEHQLALEERELSNRKALEDLQAQHAQLKNTMQEKDQEHQLALEDLQAQHAQLKKTMQDQEHQLALEDLQAQHAELKKTMQEKDREHQLALEEISQELRRKTQLLEAALQDTFTCDLKDKKSLVAFAQDRGVRLIRASYLYHLRREDSPLPRRQQAENEVFTVGSAEKSALVTCDEVAEWAAGTKDAIICSVSHAWETREHPDPCRFQLGQLVDMVSLYEATYGSEIWIFYDYTSLYQYPRTTEQEVIFRKTLHNMHVMYSHDFTVTLRIEGLTPDDVWNAMLQDKVTVYHKPRDSVEAVPLEVLTRNRDEYLGRGWCISEVEWSSARGIQAQNQRIDCGAEDELAGKVPLAPAAFEKKVQNAVFTQKEADLQVVINLQKKIFEAKVEQCPQVILQRLREAEVKQLAESLQHYKELQIFQLSYWQGTPDLAKKLVELLLGPDTKLEDLQITYADDRYGDWKGSAPGTGDALAKALGAKLPGNSTVRKLELEYNAITTEGGKELLKGLQSNNHIAQFELKRGNYIDDKVHTDIQKIVKKKKAASSPKKSLRDSFGMPFYPSQARSQEQIPPNQESAFPSKPRIKNQSDLMQNKAVTKLHLYHRELGDSEAQALAAMLFENRSVTSMNLCNNCIGDKGGQALLEAMRKNRSIIYMNLDENPKISKQVLKEIQDIVARNKERRPRGVAP